jgi:hypothetical protein
MEGLSVCRSKDWDHLIVIGPSYNCSVTTLVGENRLSSIEEFSAEMRGTNSASCTELCVYFVSLLPVLLQ